MRESPESDMGWARPRGNTRLIRKKEISPKVMEVE